MSPPALLPWTEMGIGCIIRIPLKRRWSCFESSVVRGVHFVHSSSYCIHGTRVRDVECHQVKRTVLKTRSIDFNGNVKPITRIDMGGVLRIGRIFAVGVS